MAFASYTENIAERLIEAQRNFAEELSSLRVRLASSDFEEREAIGRDITTFKKRLERFLNELEKRSKKLFDEAAKRLSDHRIDVFRHIEKKDKQAADARSERDRAISQLNVAREKNSELRTERDRALRKIGELTKMLNDLAAENRKLRSKQQDKQAWDQAVSGIKRR